MQNQIPKNWQKVKLGDYVDITSSKRIFAHEYIKDGIPFYRGKEIIEKFNGNEVSTDLFISPQKFKDIESRFGVPQTGDMLLTSVGTLGIPYLVGKDEKFYFKDGNLTWFRKFKDLDNRFLYLWIQSALGKAQLVKHTIGSSQQALTIDGLKNIEIDLPDFPQQQKIASILSAFDDKIEVNNKNSKTLEEMAQALFKEWFVNFKFLGYEKMEFIDSELGKIPKGWLSNLGEHVEVTDYVANGSFASLKENVTYHSDKNYAVLVRTKDLQENFANDLVYIDQDAYEFLKKSKLFGGELILSNVGNVGAIFRCPKLDIPMSLGPNAVVVKNSVYTLYLFLYFRGNVGQSKLGGITGGSSQPKFNKTDFRNLKLIFPLEALIEKFNDFVEPIYERIDQAEQENQKLAALRDLLLPKLMKGEIRV
ncbi:MAG: restriction endonuclease subunit S [Candidatus Daviesbacteria bacterium]|nr:restriction endonuclease subunit S [Candidatus Daviesbacteria bacterium]